MRTKLLVKYNREGAIDSYKRIKSKQSLFMELKETFAIVFKNEPQKSFVKAGVMNSDETLTQDGREIFLNYLVSKFGSEFKTEVVDKIIAEQEKQSSNS